MLWQHARRGSQRRWWQEPWGEDGGTEGWGPDGPLPPSSSGGALPSAEQVITFFCCDGSMVQLGARPSPLQQAERRSARRHSAADSMPLPEEQGLCIGSVFTIRATNGHDVKRKLDLRGFCFSTERLFERVEDTVLARGGEVFEAERLLKRCPAVTLLCCAVLRHFCAPLLCDAVPRHVVLFAVCCVRCVITSRFEWQHHSRLPLTCSGVHEALVMTVAIPLLW